MIKVKICGIRRIEDAILASDMGADAIGLLVGQRHPASDFISADQAKQIASKMPPTCMPILVTHLERWREICDLVLATSICTIQLHGKTPLVDVRHVRENLPHLNIIKAVHISGPDAVDQAIYYARVVDGILLDTYLSSTNQVGGTGVTHDWNISAAIVQMLEKPVILAGGLRDTNVQEAIAQVQPAVVDANTSTKAADGFKDPDRLRKFIQAAKSAGRGKEGGRSPW